MGAAQSTRSLASVQLVSKRVRPVQRMVDCEGRGGVLSESRGGTHQQPEAFHLTYIRSRSSHSFLFWMTVASRICLVYFGPESTGIAWESSEA